MERRGGTPGREQEGTLNRRRACAPPGEQCPLLQFEDPASDAVATTHVPRPAGRPLGTPSPVILAAAFFLAVLLAFAASPQTASASGWSPCEAASRSVPRAESAHGPRLPSPVALMVGAARAPTARRPDFDDHGVERRDSGPRPTTHHVGRSADVPILHPLLAVGSHAGAAARLSDCVVGPPAERAVAHNPPRAPPWPS